jgi:hypothetical protein
MSALGQKQTFRGANVMSTLPPKADIQSVVGMSANGQWRERRSKKLRPASTGPNNGMNSTHRLHMRERIMKLS